MSLGLLGGVGAGPGRGGSVREKNITVALHSVALRFPGFERMSQKNRATPPQRPLQPLPVQLFKGCRTSGCHVEGVAVQGSVAATLSPVALQWAT